MRAWMLGTTAVAVASLVGCATPPVLDTSGLQAKIQAVEGDDFGTCMSQSHLAAVELENAKGRLASLREGSESPTDLDEGNAAADRASDHKRNASRACDALHASLDARLNNLDAAVLELDERLDQLEQKREILRGVTFATGSAKLTPHARTVLDVVANKLIRNPSNVEIGGYASRTGSRELNVRLSQERADAVRAFLIERGASADRVTARGYGWDNPIASNDTAEGRLANQRIEITYK